MEEYQRALKSMPCKKDREEIERLKEELHESRSDLSRREVRWHAAIARLRSRIEELEGERDELKSRVHRLEEDRISLQSKLSELKTAGSINKLYLRRSASSLSSARQSVSVLAIFYAVLKEVFSHSDHAIRRMRQQKQFVSSCRLSGRTLSRLNSADKPYTAQVRRSTTPNIPICSSCDLPPVHVDRAGANTTATLHQAVPSTTGTRESVLSGGYFTGDDDAASSGSGCVDVRQSGGDVVPEQTTTASATVGDVTAVSSLHAVQALSPVSSQHGADGPNTAPLNADKVEKTEENLPAPRTAASGSVVRTVKHADGSVEEAYSNGAVVVTYSNGSVKEVFPDGVTIVVSLFNGDIKRTLPDGRVLDRLLELAQFRSLQLVRPLSMYVRPPYLVAVRQKR
ncbi:unnamed protein product [Echinostoma caproni]|uniref:Centromere protein J C-terminal domain-containing protein n=1 Tax=Echinostoma caproni TaxID=27848 RepID=A0A3P8L6K0_9TREM|nr:unnamed protein product [Echinostoma caproni]